MAKKVTYKEPAGYFTPGMLKAAQEWEKNHKAETTKKSAPAPKKGKK